MIAVHTVVVAVAATTTTKQRKCMMVCLLAHRYECSHCNKCCATERLLRDHMRQHGKMLLRSVIG